MSSCSVSRSESERRLVSPKRRMRPSAGQGGRRGTQLVAEWVLFGFRVPLEGLNEEHAPRLCSRKSRPGVNRGGWIFGTRGRGVRSPASLLPVLRLTPAWPWRGRALGARERASPFPRPSHPPTLTRLIEMSAAGSVGGWWVLHKETLADLGLLTCLAPL